MTAATRRQKLFTKEFDRYLRTRDLSESINQYLPSIKYVSPSNDVKHLPVHPVDKKIVDDYEKYHILEKSFYAQPKLTEKLKSEKTNLRALKSKTLRRPTRHLFTQIRSNRKTIRQMLSDIRTQAGKTDSTLKAAASAKKKVFTNKSFIK
jgi:hypothetical protein